MEAEKVGAAVLAGVFMMIEYPDFLIIGAARSGTSSLHRNLESHPQILGPKFLTGNKKEAHFFDKRSKYNQGLSWYLGLWPHTKGVLKFESTPNYLYVYEVPWRIKESLPNWKRLKFIVMLRDPVKRAWSHFYHWREKHRLPPDALMDAETDWVRKGLYFEQLKHWHDNFEKKQFLIIKSEDFYADIKNVILEVHKWLKVQAIYITNPIYFDPKKNNKHKKSRYPAVPEHIKSWLSEYYKPHNERLFEYLGREFEDWL